MRLSRTIPPILYALPLLFLGVFFFYPLARILGVSFGADGSLTLAAIAETLSQPFFWRVLWFTTWQAAASTGLTLILGLPLAYVFARYAFPGKALLRALTTIPFVMPTVVVAVAFTALLGENGLLNNWIQAGLRLDGPPIRLMNTVWIILIAHAFYNVSVVLRTVGSFWANLNPRLEEAAAVLGAGPGRLFWEITLPLLMPSIIAAGLLVFLFCFTSFGVVLILGGLGFATLEVEIYRQAVSYFNLPVAGFLALVQMALTFAVMAVYTRMQSRASLPVEMRPQSITARHASTARERLFVGLSLTAMLVILLSPLLALAWRSVTLGGDGLTFAYFRALADNPRNSAFFVPPLEAVRNSLLYASATVVLSLFLGVISAYLLARRRSRISAILDPIFLLPLGTSAVTLGFGYIIAMGSLRTSLILVPIAHTLIATPFVVRTLLPALRGLDPHLREAGQVLGANPLRVWWEVDVPLLWRAMLVGAVFAFTISLGEFGASLLITRPDMPTMPVVIYRALSRPGLVNYGQALAMSTILMVVSAAGILIIERFRVDDAEF
ncbi:MAG: iron ABC transporter permease [Caldilineaceae bacterium]|nr:iron ABC transporter permease [Caldilineaceae bacterium]MBP8107717.1 iron ABC transporter permease [Caldilineaceae bacterium]MBP8122864.1 iron ABC transporter permease [Caldilineaceae bacterium]MBP9071258.1 iron ABC transporter permease [Caldilineaceae bacterium]